MGRPDRVVEVVSLRDAPDVSAVSSIPAGFRAVEPGGAARQVYAERDPPEGSRLGVAQRQSGSRRDVTM